MRIQTRWVAICMASFCLALSSPLEAQDVSCSYSTCALRLDEGLLSSRILAGDQGEAVARVGAFGTDLGRQLALPDSALHHIQRANKRFRVGTILSLVGLASGLYGSFAGGDLEGDRLVAVIAGGVLTVSGGAVTRRGRSELNQGLWLYNRQFAR